MLFGVCGSYATRTLAGFQFEGLYLPWALIAFTVLVGGNPMMDIFGVIAGHLYYFLLEVLPTTKGWTLLQTPSFLYVLVVTAGVADPMCLPAAMVG